MGRLQCWARATNAIMCNGLNGSPSVFMLCNWGPCGLRFGTPQNPLQIFPVAHKIAQFAPNCRACYVQVEPQFLGLMYFSWFDGSFTANAWSCILLVLCCRFHCMVLICQHPTKGKSDDVKTHALVLLYIRVCARAHACMRVERPLIFSVECCCGSMYSIVEINYRYYMDFVGFIHEQIPLVVKVNFWVERKMKVSFCVWYTLNGSVHVQNGFIFFSNFCYLAVSMLQLILWLDVNKCGL